MKYYIIRELCKERNIMSCFEVYDNYSNILMTDPNKVLENIIDIYNEYSEYIDDEFCIPSIQEINDQDGVMELYNDHSIVVWLEVLKIQ
jgi:hypothetical protein